MLIGPNFSAKINGEDDVKIKRALFNFINKTKAI